MNEALLHIAWAHRLYSHIESKHTIEVIDVGMHNEHSGADFHNAKVRIDGMLWAGDVEIHLEGKHWREHRHDEDDAYTSVILHIVGAKDEPIFDSRHRAIPSGRLVLPEKLVDKAKELTTRTNYCHRATWLKEALSKVQLDRWLSSLAQERLQERSIPWLSLLKENRGDNVEVFHRLLLRYFGFGLNNEAMERLARSIPARALIKQGDSLLQLDAMLLGQANMLEELPQREQYVQDLQREYKFLANKYQLTPLPLGIFRRAKTRPQSFPLRRIVQLSRLLYHIPFLADRILQVQSPNDLKELFRYENRADFWSDYFAHSTSSSSLALTQEAIFTIGLNVASLYQYLVAHQRPDTAHLSDQAFALLKQLPAERNSILRRMISIGLSAQNALESQALLQLYHRHCQRRMCLYCPIGRIGLVLSQRL